MTLRHDTRILATRLPLVAVACLTAALALGGCDDGDASAAAGDPPTTAASSSSPSATPTPTPTPSETAGDSATPTPAPTPTTSPSEKPRMIAYAGGESAGATVHGTADEGKLTGAPQAFQDFIGRTAQALDSSDCDAATGVTVEFVRTDGYAVGGVNECGGYAALWAVVDGHWKEIQGTQDSWDCKVLHRYRVPSEIVGDSCYDYDAQQEHHYHQA